MSKPDPASEYRRRLTSLEAWAERYTRTYGRIALARLGLAVAFLVMAWASLVERWMSGLWLLLPVAGFLTLVVMHERVSRVRDRVARAIAFYDLGIARIENHWAGRGQFDFLPDVANHLYAADLDLFGRGSLFELLSTARTRTGQETLARWLLEPAGPDEIVARQEAVEELRSMVDLREDLATLGKEVVTSIHPHSIVAWGEAPDSLTRKWPRFVAPVLASITSVAIVAVVIADTRESWVTLLAVLAIEWGFVRLFRPRVNEVLAGADRHGREFQFLSQLIRRIESRSFGSTKLRDLQTAIQTAGVPASGQLSRFARLGDLADMRRNMMFTLLMFLLAMTQVAFALEAWRRVCGPALAGWLSAVGEFEALCVLSGYAYEHPRDPFPEVAGAGPVFDGQRLRHPLLPDCVGNDVVLGTAPQLVVVSGSNMSGKSTLLRTVGINAVLAQAGAPVRAGRLRLSPLAIGATLRIQDSLQAGTSRFYAEIQRIREIVELASGEKAVLFLLDEVLHGTNSHDRALGAAGILRGLVRRGAVGLVTTHDLALTGIADDLGPAALNVHFEDRLEGEIMAFDYRIKPGVVQHSNALELMRALGLEV